MNREIEIYEKYENLPEVQELVKRIRSQKNFFARELLSEFEEQALNGAEFYPINRSLPDFLFFSYAESDEWKLKWFETYAPDQTERINYLKMKINKKRVNFCLFKKLAADTL